VLSDGDSVIRRVTMKTQQTHAPITDIRLADMVDMSVTSREGARSTQVPSKDANRRTHRLSIIPLDFC
jgi:hypothetical protein